MTWAQRERESKRETAASQKIRVRCADCRWSYRGWFLDARKAFQAHREMKHA